MKSSDKYIPEQTGGGRTDFSHAVSLSSVDKAHKLFLSAKARLLNVMEWHNYAGPASSTFCLTDDKGIHLHRLAQPGDHICIDLPDAPGPDAGDGLEWVLITKISEDGNIKSAGQSITMIVRPTTNPVNNDNAIAHFYTAEASSVFTIARYGTKVSAEAHGRNEHPNNKGVDLHDAIRNTAIALSASTGLSGGQWQNMVEGLLG